MRVEFLEPEGGYTNEVVSDALSLAGVMVPPETVLIWTRFERVIAYDWAIREHLGASDNPGQRRDRPLFLDQYRQAPQ